MKKVEYILSCVAVSLFFIHSVYTESVTVSDTSYPTCKTYYLSSLNPDLDIYYYGAELDGECLIKVDGGINKLCVTAKTFEISNSCQVKVKYFGGYYYSSLSPDKWIVFSTVIWTGAIPIVRKCVMFTTYALGVSMRQQQLVCEDVARERHFLVFGSLDFTYIWLFPPSMKSETEKVLLWRDLCMQLENSNEFTDV